MTRPVLEFVSLMRPAFSLDGPEVVIGRSAGCTLQLEADGVAERHARIRITPAGEATVQDLDSFSGTQRNGSFVYGQQVLGDGDELRIGGVVLRFRKTAPASFADPSSAGRTLMGVGPPAELVAALGSRTVEMAPVDPGVSVGAAEPEPTNNRTVQMDSSAIEALLKADAAKGKAPEVSFDAVTTPGGGVSSPSGGGPSKMAFDEADRTVATPPTFAEDATAAQKQRTRAAFAQTLPPPTAAEYEKLRGDLQAARDAAKAADAAKASQPSPSPGGAGKGEASPPQQQRTIAMEAPKIPPAAPPAPAKAPEQPKTMMAQAPVLPGNLPTAPQAPLTAPMPSASNQQRTMAMQAPTAPPAAPPPRGPQPPTGQRPVVVPLPPAEQPKTMMAEAPVLPGRLPTAPTAPPRPAVTPIAPLPPPAPAAPLGGVTAQSMPVIPAPPPPQSTQQMPAPSAPQGYGAYVPPGQQPQPQSYQQAAYAPPAAQQPMSSAQSEPYIPPKKGPLGSFSRALAFIGQMFSLAFKHKAILSPILWDLAITTPISIGIGVAMGFVHSEGAFYGLLGLGTLLLYFVDYCCNAFTASLMYDYATTGQADGAQARRRVMKALGGILVFAGVSALLDVASTYARERNDVLAKIVLRVLRAIWTTATYVIMPAMVIEGVSFGDAFGRSKQLMDKDPTGVGAGIVAMSITSYIAAIIIFPLAYFALRFGVRIHPAVGGILFFTFINLYWSISGWLKIAYSTCFYVWARECQRTGSQDHALAPRPLRTAIDAG